jgi:hypothetical protein
LLALLEALLISLIHHVSFVNLFKAKDLLSKGL